jgi:hypothetical protein
MRKLDELVVMVNDYLPSNAIMVSPEMFAAMKAAQNGTIDEMCKEADVKLQRLVDRLKPLIEREKEVGR